MHIGCVGCINNDSKYWLIIQMQLLPPYSAIHYPTFSLLSLPLNCLSSCPTISLFCFTFLLLTALLSYFCTSSLLSHFTFHFLSITSLSLRYPLALIPSFFFLFALLVLLISLFLRLFFILSPYLSLSLPFDLSSPPPLSYLNIVPSRFSLCRLRVIHSPFISPSLSLLFLSLSLSLPPLLISLRLSFFLSLSHSLSYSLHLSPLRSLPFLLSLSCTIFNDDETDINPDVHFTDNGSFTSLTT